jgi:DNA-binding response OmpR family regulator
VVSDAVRILLVEDEIIIAMLMTDDLTDAGYEVVGPVGRLEQAVDMAKRQTFDLAVLDGNLHGEKVFPVADVLVGRGIPFLFLTGYSSNDMPKRFFKHTVLQKPIVLEHLLQWITQTTADGHAVPTARA